MFDNSFAEFNFASRTAEEEDDTDINAFVCVYVITYFG